MSGATSELEPIVDADSEDDIDWEEVEVQPQERHIEITLHERPKLKDQVKSVFLFTLAVKFLSQPSRFYRKKGISHAERVLRINCHKIHTVSLLANAWVRNKWLNDELLHVRCTASSSFRMKFHLFPGPAHLLRPYVHSNFLRYDSQVSCTTPNEAWSNVRESPRYSCQVVVRVLL